MTQRQPTAHAPLLKARINRGVLVALLTFVFLIFVSLFALYMGQPPAAVAANAPPTEFSSGRAMQHLKVIGRAPHPMGSSEHAFVRDYILKQLTELGLAPEVQATTAFNYRRNLPFPAGAVENIVGRLKGTENGKPVLLVCHYDSVANGPGVSDDGAAVAAMLETLRALKETQPLKNDVLFLFTDGEEVGLLGVEAFINSYPAAKDAGVVFNFEARGSSGPVVMFETSVQNRALIKEFAAAVRYPAANSLMYEVYRFLPNDTDLREFKNAGLPGLNFAFINQSTNYHTRLDNIENLDERSLQHHGSYALGLTRHFGNLNLPVKREGNAVYFDVLSTIVLHYPASWAIPLALLNILLFLLIGIWGIRKKALAVSGLLQGFLALFLSMIGAGLIVSLIWWLLAKLIPSYSSMPGDVYHSYLYFVGFVALTAAITTTFFVLFGKRIGVLNLWGGAMLWWLILTVSSAVFLPGASYLFTWPLFFSLIALGGTIALREHASASWRSLALLAIAAIPVLILFSSLIQLLLVGLTVRSAGIVMVLVALVMGLLAPHVSLMTTQGKWFLPGSLTAIGLGLLIAGSLTSGFSPRQPQPVNLIYGLNADTGNAVWASTGNQTDGWTSQFLSQETQRKVLNDFFPYISREYQTGRAPVAALAAPNVEVLDENLDNGVRTLRLHITSLRQAPVMTVAVETDVEVEVTRINERELEPGHTFVSGTPKNIWGMRFYALPTGGVDLTLQVKSPYTIRLKVVDQSYNLPDIPNVSIDFPSDYLMWAPFSVNNSTLVSRSFTF